MLFTQYVWFGTPGSSPGGYQMKCRRSSASKRLAGRKYRCAEQHAPTSYTHSSMYINSSGLQSLPQCRAEGRKGHPRSPCASPPTPHADCSRAAVRAP